MEKVKSYYDNRAKSYNELFDVLYYKIFDTITWKYLEPYIPSDLSALVLDAGGGTGRWAIRMARKGCEVVLMDASEEMLKVAAKSLEEEGLQHKIIIKSGDISRTGYADKTFDLILCEHALFLFKEPDTVIRELNRVLKKKARLVVSVHNRYVQSLVALAERPSSGNVGGALNVLLRKRHGAMDQREEVKIYTWTPDEFREMLERNGFHVEKIVGKGYTVPLRISKELFMKKEYPKELFDKILQFELALCERPDALALAGHLQAIACKP